MIAQSVLFNNNRIVDTNIQQNSPNSAIHEFIVVRNYGKMKLGIAICLFKGGLFTPEVEDDFINLTADIALLGFHDELLGEIQMKAEA